MMKLKEEYIKAIVVLESMEAIPMSKDYATSIPEGSGVYVVTDHFKDQPIVIYVGRTTTGNLRSRLTSYHLSGAPTSARIKKGLIDTGICRDNRTARAYIETNCRVRFVEILDKETRRFMEHFFIAYFTPSLNR